MLCVRIMVEDVARSQSFESGGSGHTPCKYNSKFSEIRFRSGGKRVKKGEKDANTPTSITGRTRPVGCSKTGGGQQQNNPSSLHLWRVQGVGLK